MNQKTCLPILILFFLIAACDKDDLHRPASPDDSLSEYTFPGMPTYDQEALERVASEFALPFFQNFI